ncbi:polymeric immunoglobulin receptor-like [Esox lucius]|uniref:polymeric immunoglobulin receptor-like n=1 Tax=Esox lucius TaxID=8010 RepID=UPI001477872B|nr:polymeric immunoglobulin receptor-like [Esox lucius]
MSILLIFTLLFFMTGSVNSFKVTGYSGGTVIIHCHYNNQEESNGKYFCKKNTFLGCEDKIRSGSQNTWQHRGRFSLYDDTEGKYFTVVIRQLTRQDEGTYRCAVDLYLDHDSYTKVELKVNEDECCTKTDTITNNLGGEATIICNYPENQEYSHVYLCKEDNHSKIYCEIISADSTSAKSGRFSLTDRREKRYTVTISNLTEDDTGTYWCGVENKKTGEHYISLFTEVHLSVIVSTTKPTTTSATSKTITTTYATSKTITTTSPTSNPTSTPTTSTNSSSSVNRPDTPLVIFVCVCVVVLLLLICLFILYRQKHKKTTAISPLHILNTDPGVNREGRHGDMSTSTRIPAAPMKPPPPSVKRTHPAVTMLL